MIRQHTAFMIERALMQSEERSIAVTTFAPPGWQTKRPTSSMATPMRAKMPSTAGRRSGRGECRHIGPQDDAESADRRSTP